MPYFFLSMRNNTNKC